VAASAGDGYINAMQARMYAILALILPIRAQRGSRLG
jgi:hypothetical protein